MIETLNEEQVASLRKMVREAADSLTRQDAEKDLRKDIADRAKEELEMPRKVFNQLVKVIHKQNIEKIAEEVNELTDLVEILKK